MELTDQELIDIRKANDELKSLQETDKEIRKLYAEAVSAFRHIAKDAEDLSNRLYAKASYFEDKLRAL